MVIITINGKKKDREFQNMAQALAFAYQNGECYGAETVELAFDGKGGKPNGGKGGGGGFTQADIDKACEKAVKEVNEQLISQLEALNTELKANEAEIAKLKEQLTAKNDTIAEQLGNPEPVVETEGSGGAGGKPVTDPAEGSGDVVDPADGSEPVEEAGGDNTAQA
jgi:flagellar motility protein MotE (MotC chaperone)